MNQRKAPGFEGLDGEGPLAKQLERVLQSSGILQLVCAILFLMSIPSFPSAAGIIFDDGQKHYSVS